MIKNLMFDCGGVFINTRNTSHYHRLLIKEFMLSKAQIDDVLNRYGPLLKVGRITPKQFIDKLKVKFKNQADTNLLMTRWHKHYYARKSEINWPLIKLTLKLKKKYKIYMLTDTVDLPDELKAREIYAIFEEVFKSFEMQTSKESLDSYKHLISMTKIKPQETIFIDDKASNVELARKLKFQGILYENNRQLIKEFKRFNVL